MDDFAAAAPAANNRLNGFAAQISAGAEASLPTLSAQARAEHATVYDLAERCAVGSGALAAVRTASLGVAACIAVAENWGAEHGVTITAALLDELGELFAAESRAVLRQREAAEPPDALRAAGIGIFAKSRPAAKPLHRQAKHRERSRPNAKAEADPEAAHDAEPPPPLDPDELAEDQRIVRAAEHCTVQSSTEDVVAQLFALACAKAYRFDHTDGDWYIWRDSHWRRDLRHRTFHRVRLFCRALRKRLDNPPEGIGKIAFAAAVEKAARSDPHIAVAHDVWDRDPFLLGTPAGIIHLRTGQMRPATPEDYIRRATSVAPAEPGTPAPIWEKFLDEATANDKETQRFLQKFHGYTLTADIAQEIMEFIHGPGGCGKGTFIKPLIFIMGDYAVNVPIEFFTAHSRINLEYYRHRIAGARLITSTETEQGSTWNETLIKELTGNENKVSARAPFGRPFDYWPTAKICIVGNHAPKLKARTEEMERKLRIAPFTRKPENPDPTLKNRMRAEYPQILRWLIDGAVAQYKEGVGTCPAVAIATGAYFEVQDRFGRWIEDECTIDPYGGLRTKPPVLLASFNAWAKDNGEEIMDMVQFAELVDRHPGLKRKKSDGARWVVGIALKAKPDKRQQQEPDQDPNQEPWGSHDADF